MSKTSKVNTVILGTLAVLVVFGMIISALNSYNAEVSIFKDGEVILELDPLRNQEVIVNDDQIVKITQDGISSHNLKGEELWSDTLNLDTIVVRQQQPYIAVSSNGSREITIFNDKGRQGKIETFHPIIYYSINENGDVAVIEKVDGEGYRVSAYDRKGSFIKGRMSYSSGGSFPVVATIDPNTEVMLISYINILGSKLTSVIAALPLEEDEINGKDALVYGIEQSDNIVTEIYFLSEELWVALGDNYTTFYSMEGEEVDRIDDIFATYTSYLYSKPKFGKFFPVIGTDSKTTSSIHKKETLYMFNLDREIICEVPFEDQVTYFYADQKGVIVGEGRRYSGFNKMGHQYFEYRAAQDVEKVVPIANEVIAITKDKVLLLQ